MSDFGRHSFNVRCFFFKMYDASIFFTDSGRCLACTAGEAVETV